MKTVLPFRLASARASEHEHGARSVAPRRTLESERRSKTPLSASATVFACAIILAAFLPSASAQSSLDFADAPAPYPTTLKDNGPRHTATGPQLGLSRDTENDGIPDALAQGDDNAATDDEDGVEFVTALVPGQVARVDVTVFGAPNGARLEGWIDFGLDGSWADTGDRIFSSVFVTNGLNSLPFPVPAGAKIGATFARFRISFSGDLNFTGAAGNGEVEDYRVGVSSSMDFGDAPISTATAGGLNYPTLLSQNGARHRIVQGFLLGKLIDEEPDGQPNAGATGDDLNPRTADDEDGIVFTSALVAGSNATVRVTCTIPANQTGRLNAWIDFNLDGDWNDPGEQIFTDLLVADGAKDFSFAVPASAVGGTTYSRFRLNLQGKLQPTGAATEGEVEDHIVTVTAALDFGDAPKPYPTLLADNGARHAFTNTFALGLKIDGESDGAPDAAAKGDDASNLEDEDGVTFTSGIAPSTTASVQVYLTGANLAGAPSGILNAWMDFNRDGDWADPGEQIFTNRSLVAGVNNLTFPVPAAASQGLTYARFRLNHQGGLSYTGAASDGEVEDYAVNISPRLDYGDAPAPYPTLLADDGARHVFNPDIFLGLRIDSEPDGQPHSFAQGDDLGGGPDEDGVTFTSLMIPGNTATVRVRASTTGFLSAWIDFDVNGSWAEAGEKIFDVRTIAGGTNDLTFNVPASAKGGRTFARFRFTTAQSVLNFTGLAPNGEVEDYIVTVTPDRDRCDLDCEGREFWLTFPGNYAPDPDNPARLSLCLHGAPGTAVAVTVPGIAFSTNIVIPAAQATTVALPRAAELGNLIDVVTNLGIHVVASAPIGVQAFDHARYTTDSYLGLHTSVLGRAYVVMGYGNTHTGVPPLNGSQFAMVASESNTVVYILPSATTAGHPAGVPYNIVLKQPGDTYQLRNTSDAPADLTGTLIVADKPIAVFGGHQNTTIPSPTVWFQDYIVEQLLPVNTWGNDFYTAPLATRSLGDTFRVLAAYDSTSVFVNGAAAAVLNRGEFYETKLTAGAHITSSRPVSVAQFANSGDYDGNTNADPFMVTVQATRHYSNNYRVCTPANDFPTNYVCVIAPSGIIGTVQIDGVGLAGPFIAIGGTGYTYARALVTPGTHRVTGQGAFACYVYGWAEYDSYGHPGCFFFGDVRAPTINPTTGATTASVNDYPNTPGFVPAPNLASTAVVQDNCSPELPGPTQDPRPGVLLAPGVHNLRLSVFDANGNEGETNVVFTVVDPSPVSINCPQNITVACQTNNGAFVNFEVTAHSTYDPMVPVVSTPPSGSFFPSGTTVVTNIATSLAGETDVCYFTVTVLCDTRVGAVRTTNGLTLSWTGTATLQSSTNLSGPWTTVTNSGNSYVAPLTGDRKFFRVLY